MTCVSASECWAVGAYTASFGTDQTLVLRVHGELNTDTNTNAYSNRNCNGHVHAYANANCYYTPTPTATATLETYSDTETSPNSGTAPVASPIHIGN